MFKEIQNLSVKRDRHVFKDFVWYSIRSRCFVVGERFETGHIDVHIARGGDDVVSGGGARFAMEVCEMISGIWFVPGVVTWSG